ncbi:putative leucine-rich repeat-containing, plant-type, leucine-rich repeat domain superfamily [Helianthus annuus]|nr:putative leucine-rich repeat-containing, plant-type, leucine-rich repeat domain superfamily [Helianthus annuus]KAJ0479149.1 putative leucine-rich repeat-containing, plant-type, leucine-rich repeat domain superfamily [Helianthus annuus]KAJ0847422.1 putative leucine-rich repeat-containing, plant-type, leucine-rich repeat domain superfamily [Helianthus annuus]KAJ0856387.1 putative leucine-rich repeat-containing, plant-type, leucine-rich repeat domain superfamily [Helianthus annuus]
MGYACWGLGIHLVFICILLVTMAHECAGGGNLTTASCSEQERLALLKFKHSIKDDHGMLSSWVGDDCCKWERVGCDHATGRVVSLHLRRTFRDDYYLFDRAGLFVEDDNLDSVDEDYYLEGDEVNSCLTELVNLKHLDLSGNDFYRIRIPEFIGSFKHLRYLNLSSVGFSGKIPHQIGNLSNLKVLDLNSPSYYLKELMIDDMSWISGLSKLEHLDLSGVDLSRVQNLDNLLYTIPSLLNLSLSACGVSMSHLGSCHPNSSKELSKFKHLDLSENDFRGQLPGLILNMTSLKFLDFSENNLSRPWRFENFINMIPSVSELRLSGCWIQNINFSPTNLNFSTHSNIQHLDLSFNEIESRFPSVLTNISSLLSLDISGNMLNSLIPVMPNLLKLDISANNFMHIDDIGIWRQCHIKEIIGSDNKLKGEMIGPSTNVSKCTQNALEILYLDFNRLNLSIPESLRRLTNLRGLDLSYNELIGPFPKALGKLRSLQGLYLSYNQLSGSIPESLGKLTSLRMLSVSSNLLSGPIPDSIGQLTNLHLLDISGNSFQGVVSEDLFANLSMLKYLNADYNNKLLFNISRAWIPPFQLKSLRLSSCKINNGFPQWLQSQTKLEELVLSNAGLFGPLPTWLRLMPIIRVLDLSHNKLTGPLMNLPSVYEEVRYESGSSLLLQKNLFSGLIPKWLCKRRDLLVLDLSRNRLTGKIPKCLWNLSLNVMILGSNKLSGALPSSLGRNNPSLKWLQLNDNNLNGELPQDFGYYTNLQFLDLGENKLSGNIPEWIGENVTMLVAMRLHKNNFTGRIPHSLCKSQQLQILDLAHNNLIGSIPHCFGELDGMKGNSFHGFHLLFSGYGNVMQVLKGVSLDYTNTVGFVLNMDLSSNNLVGEIPKPLTALDGLMGLNLSNNHFSGGIPKSIGNMKSLMSLDLSANKLNGTIPPSMAALNFLSYLNLSHNNLSGRIPTGNQLQTLIDPSIYADNTYLCGAPLPTECSPHKYTASKEKYENGNEPKKVWLYVDISSGFATGFWGIIGVLLLKKQWRDKLFHVL